MKSYSDLLAETKNDLAKLEPSPELVTGSIYLLSVQTHPIPALGTAVFVQAWYELGLDKEILTQELNKLHDALK